MSDLVPLDAESPQSRGGRARRDKLSPETRSEIARKAAVARWGDAVERPVVDRRDERKAMALRLKQAREARGLTRKFVSVRLGRTVTTLIHWETGRGAPGPNKLSEIAALLDVTAEWLLTGGETSTGGPEDAAGGTRGPSTTPSTAGGGGLLHQGVAEDDQERQASDLFRRLDPAKRRVVLDMMVLLAEDDPGVRRPRMQEDEEVAKGRASRRVASSPDRRGGTVLVPRAENSKDDDRPGQGDPAMICGRDGELDAADRRPSEG